MITIQIRTRKEMKGRVRTKGKGGNTEREMGRERGRVMERRGGEEDIAREMVEKIEGREEDGEGNEAKRG